MACAKIFRILKPRGSQPYFSAFAAGPRTGPDRPLISGAVVSLYAAEWAAMDSILKVMDWVGLSGTVGDLTPRGAADGVHRSGTSTCANQQLVRSTYRTAIDANTAWASWATGENLQDDVQHNSGSLGHRDPGHQKESEDVIGYQIDILDAATINNAYAVLIRVEMKSSALNSLAVCITCSSQGGRHIAISPSGAHITTAFRGRSDSKGSSQLLWGRFSL